MDSTPEVKRSLALDALAKLYEDESPRPYEFDRYQAADVWSVHPRTALDRLNKLVAEGKATSRLARIPGQQARRYYTLEDINE